MRDKFLIPKQNDRFANDMLCYLAERFNAPNCSKLEVKVIHYRTRADWMKLWSLASKTRTRSKTEYVKAAKPTRKKWLEVNGWLFQVQTMDMTTGKREFADEKLREEAMVRRGLSPDLARALSPFNAVIFLNMENIEQANKAGQPFALHGVITHECIHIVERRTGQVIVKDFDAQHNFLDDQSASALAEFIKKLGNYEFMRRYLRSNGGA